MLIWLCTSQCPPQCFFMFSFPLSQPRDSYTMAGMCLPQAFELAVPKCRYSSLNHRLCTQSDCQIGLHYPSYFSLNTSPYMYSLSPAPLYLYQFPLYSMSFIYCDQQTLKLAPRTPGILMFTYFSCLLFISSCYIVSLMRV